MDYLARESADLSNELWNRIDETVIDTLKQHLISRRFLKIAGPVGAGVSSIILDGTNKGESYDEGIARIVGRTKVELPLFYEDFNLLGRDLEYENNTGTPIDLSVAITAAKKCARREDELVLLGNKALGTQGLTTAKGAFKVKKGDWKKGDTGYSDVAKAMTHLIESDYLGRYALVLSSDLYLALQRLEPSIGLLEVERIQKLIGNEICMSGSIGTNKAVLVCAEPEYMDLAIGLDFSVGYVELVNFNHQFRIMETAALRIKDPGAIVVFE